MGEKKVTKSDLVSAVHARSSCRRKDILAVFDLLLDEMRSALGDGSVIELRGFGTFEPRLRKGRVAARNPKNGESVSVPPHYVAVFRAGKDLRDAMRALQD